jgi:hypothetical protein
MPLVRHPFSRNEIDGPISRCPEMVVIFPEKATEEDGEETCTFKEYDGINDFYKSLSRSTFMLLTL